MSTLTQTSATFQSDDDFDPTDPSDNQTNWLDDLSDKWHEGDPTLSGRLKIREQVGEVEKMGIPGIGVQGFGENGEQIQQSQDQVHADVRDVTGGEQKEANGRDFEAELRHVVGEVQEIAETTSPNPTDEEKSRLEQRSKALETQTKSLFHGARDAFAEDAALQERLGDLAKELAAEIEKTKRKKLTILKIQNNLSVALQALAIPINLGAQGASLLVHPALVLLEGTKRLLLGTIGVILGKR